MPDLYAVLRDPEEAPLVGRLMNDAGDLQARADYAAWLERRHDPRAEAVRISSALLAGVSDAIERRRLAARLLDLRQHLDEWFDKLLLSPIAVRNCGEKTSENAPIRFSFECPETWGAMRPTADAKVRFCERCHSDVVRCDSLAEAERQALLGACISVDGKLTAQAYDRYCKSVTGRPDVAAIWARRIFPG